MATPQWILMQHRLEPSRKSMESQYEINTKKRQREAVRSAIKKGVLKVLDQTLLEETKGISHNAQEREKLIHLSLPSHSIHSIDELVVLSSPQLTIINLPNNFVSSILPLQSCINLIKLDLSGNEIQVLPDSKFWSALISLKILYLHGNLLTKKECILKLGASPQLQILTLHDTPVCLLSNYRHIAVNCILTLKALDYHVISDDEIIANLILAGKFRALARSFYKFLYLPVNEGDDYEMEMKRVHSLLLMVDLVQSHYSPVVIIQRWVRGWLTRKKIPKAITIHLNAIMKRKEKRERSLKDVLNASSPNCQNFPLLLKSGPPPPPTSPSNQPRLSPLPLSLYSLRDSAKRPDTAELYKAINSAKVLLKSKKSSKNTKKFIVRPTIKRPKSNIRRSASGGQIDVSFDLSVSGTHRSVENVNKVEKQNQAIKDGGEELRISKEQMKKAAETERDKQTEEAKLAAKKHPGTTKDTQAFIRNHATMNLSALRQLEKQYRYNQRNRDVESKSGLVAQIRHEREIRKERLQQYQLMVKDNIMNWRIEEETRLQRERDKHEIKREEDHLKRVTKIETEYEAIAYRHNDEEFAKKFVQTNVRIDKVITSERRRLEKEVASEVVHDAVQTQRESETERQEITKNFMKMRENRLKQQMLLDKNHLSTQMIQMVSHQLMEAKQKVAREKARRQAALDRSPTIPTSNTPRKDLSDAYNAIPEAIIADNSLLGPLLRACDTEGYSPKSMRSCTLGSHRTWQRGTHVMSGKNGNFPTITRLRSEETPLMYDMYRPMFPRWQYVGTTPFNSLQVSMKNTAAASPVLEPDTGHLYSHYMSGEDEKRQLVLQNHAAT